MKNAFIIYGAYGKLGENWFLWLKENLKNEGFEVYLPEFPTPENQTLDTWLDVFRKYEKNMNEGSIMIGHSLGCAFILDVLEKTDKKIYASFLVSGFIGALGDKILDPINKTFTEKNFDWKKIKENCEHFVLFHSDNDPYVPLNKAFKLKNKLDAELIIIRNAGHFNEKSGYKKFEKLLRKIEFIQNQRGK